jgi:hypothetical protein
MLKKVRGSLLAAPPMPERKEKARQKDGILLERMPLRDIKAQAPPQVRPSGRWTTPAQVLEVFREVREQTQRYASTTEDDLRSHFEPHFALKDLDGYQWLLLISTHTERHVAQIEEVKAAPGYPAHA